MLSSFIEVLLIIARWYATIYLVIVRLTNLHLQILWHTTAGRTR